MRQGSITTLDGLDLSIEKGEVVSILGPNGAGKTTTINLFMGFFKPTSGRVEVCGVDVSQNPGLARRQLAYIPESVNLYGNLSAIENLRYFSSLSGIHDLSNTDCDELLDRAGLQRSAFHRRSSTYSKGMRQKVCVAMALAKKAKVLLLDEPTSGLDPYAANEFAGLVCDLATQGIAALVATHDLLLARQISRELMILVSGKVRQRLQTSGLEVATLERIYLDELCLHSEKQH